MKYLLPIFLYSMAWGLDSVNETAKEKNCGEIVKSFPCAEPRPNSKYYLISNLAANGCSSNPGKKIVLPSICFNNAVFGDLDNFCKSAGSACMNQAEKMNLSAKSCETAAPGALLKEGFSAASTGSPAACAALLKAALKFSAIEPEKPRTMVAPASLPEVSKVVETASVENKEYVCKSGFHINQSIGQHASVAAAKASSEFELHNCDRNSNPRVAPWGQGQAGSGTANGAAQ